MSSRNPNSGTSGSPSPSTSPNSEENRETVVPQREEIQAADELVPKEEGEQSAAATADSASKEEENPVEKIPNQENPDEKIAKPEIPDEKGQEEEDTEEEDPDEEDPDEENAVEEIPKQEKPDEEMAQEEEDPEEEDPDEEIPEEEILELENPDAEIPQEENPEEEEPEEEDPEEEDPEEILEQESPEPGIPQEENQRQEIQEQANPHEEIPPEGENLFAYLSGAVPDIEMGEQQQMFGDIEEQKRQQAQIANQAQNQEQVLEVEPLSYYWSDNLQDYGFFDVDSETLECENAALDAMYAANLAKHTNRGTGNRGQENHTFDSIHSIPTLEPNRGIGSGELDNRAIAEILDANPTVDVNRGMGIAEPENSASAGIFGQPENPSFANMFSSFFPFETNWGIGSREPENPTIAEMFASLSPIEPNRGNTYDEMLAALPPNKRIRIDPTFYSRPAINPNKGFTIRDPQNPTNNPAQAAVPAQQDKGKGKDENPRPIETHIYIPECFLFPRSTCEEEDDVTTLKFVSVYSRNYGPLPSPGSPEHFDSLFAFISSQLPQGERISLETLKEKFARLVKKYVRLLRLREIPLNFEALATDYDQEFYRLGREVWGNAYAEGYRFPPGPVGTSGTNGDSS